MKKKWFSYLIAPVITLILELLPYGAVCNFAQPAADGTIGHIRALYSYFDMLPFGYANFAPFMTAILSCVILLLLLVHCFADKPQALSAAKKLLYVAVVLSLCPLLLGIRYFSVVGALITASLLAELFLLSAASKAPKDHPAA